MHARRIINKLNWIGKESDWKRVIRIGLEIYCRVEAYNKNWIGKELTVQGISIISYLLKESTVKHDDIRAISTVHYNIEFLEKVFLLSFINGRPYSLKRKRQFL